MASKWVEHVKEFSSKKGITYGDAMKNEECKRSYQMTKGDIKTEEIVEMTKPKMPKPEKKERKGKVVKNENPVEVSVEVPETPKKKINKKKNI
jgi:hypothetical protein